MFYCINTVLIEKDIWFHLDVRAHTRYAGDMLRDVSQPRQRRRDVCHVPFRGRRHPTQGEGSYDGGRLRRRPFDGRGQDSSQEIRAGASTIVAVVVVVRVTSSYGRKN